MENLELDLKKRRSIIVAREVKTESGQVDLNTLMDAAGIDYQEARRRSVARAKEEIKAKMGPTNPFYNSSSFMQKRLNKIKSGTEEPNQLNAEKSKKLKSPSKFITDRGLFKQ